MKIRKDINIVFCLLFVFLFISFLTAAEKKNEVTLREISENISSYKGKKLSLYLRLKNYDKVFEKITFYDNKNYDIVFDISSKEAKKKFKKQLVYLHEGMLYKVTFTINRVGASGILNADLHSFNPRILEILP